MSIDLSFYKSPVCVNIIYVQRGECGGEIYIIPNVCIMWVHTLYIREIISRIKVFVCLLARVSSIPSRLADALKGGSLLVLFGVAAPRTGFKLSVSLCTGPEIGERPRGRLLPCAGSE